MLFSFNTSHVKVNLKLWSAPDIRSIVSIHPMLKLIQRISSIPYNTLYQIPQYLSTFLKFLPATAPFAKKIHKITAIPLFLRIHAILHWLAAGKFSLYYKINCSPFSLSFFPSTSSPNTFSLNSLIIQIKSSSSCITFFKSVFNPISFEGVISPRKTEFW